MLQQQLDSQLREVARRRGVHNLRVFGSATRDPERARDLDLLVDLEPDRTLLDLVAFRREAEEILTMPVDVATPDMLKERIRARVLAEARPLSTPPTDSRSASIGLPHRSQPPG
jgi:predicted nucleotidyltransferase